MKYNNSILLKALKPKFVLFFILSASFAAFATLGDGKKSSDRKYNSKSLLSFKSTLAPGSFSLKSGFHFRGIPFVETEKNNFISLNKEAVYQKGNSTYILPLKKKILLDKVTFNPDSRTRR